MLRPAVLALVAAISFAMPALAQDQPATATTIQDPKIEPTRLELLIKPMRLDRLEVEANAWVELLSDKTREITQLQLDGQTENLTERVAEQTELVRRVDVVLEAMKARGGDVESLQQYVNASTGVTIDASDAGGLVALATDWIMSPSGGILWAINIVKFLVTLLVFKIIAGILASLVGKASARMKGASTLLRAFFVNITRKTTMLIGLVVALSMLGINIGPFLAAIGAAGFVLGFALQGTLSNFAAGIMILVYRPYDVGQVVNVAGTTGKVDAMSLVSTTLRLPDNQTVIVPNGKIWGDVITNVTSQETRRVDMKFGCSYGDDLQKAQQVLQDIISKHEKVLADPAPVIKVHELADSSVNFIVRPWAKTADYWDVFWDVTREVKERFDAEGISIPFPQRDVHMHQAVTA